MIISLADIRARHEREKLSLSLLKQLEYLNLAPLFVREHRFHPERKWRLDLYAPGYKLGIELHGGIWKGGRHTSGAGFTADREKINAALEAGIRVLEYTTDQVRSGAAVLQIERMLKEPPP
jgi:hypothetical protein